MQVSQDEGKSGVHYKIHINTFNKYILSIKSEPELFMNKKHLPRALIISHGCYILGCVNASALSYFVIWQTQKTTPPTLSALGHWP